jgi:taurine dioxygenase
MSRLVIWDNRGTQHYAVADFLPHRRVMHRVAVVTDRRTPPKHHLEVSI